MASKGITMTQKDMEDYKKATEAAAENINKISFEELENISGGSSVGEDIGIGAIAGATVGTAVGAIVGVCLIVPVAVSSEELSTKQKVAAITGFVACTSLAGFASGALRGAMRGAVIGSLEELGQE